MARSMIVKAGDTLTEIAETNYGDASYVVKLARYNGIANPDLLYVGERLELPTLKELDGPGQPVAYENGIAPPHGLAEINRTFGDVTAYIRNDGHLSREWEAEQLVSARIPFTIPISWDRRQQVKGIYCHKLLGLVIYDVFDLINRQGLKREIKSYGGCFNYRPKRQSSKLSTHSWGIALDLNPETNRQGTMGDMHPEIVAIFREAGFTWGGEWPGRNRDPMHFQYCAGY